MKKLKISMSILAIFALLLTSCSKEDNVSPGDDSNLQSVDLTFGAFLNDLSNRAMATNKSHFDQIPTCSDAEPAVARIGFSYGGNSYETEVDVLSDEEGYFTAYSEDLKIPVPNNGSVEVTLDSFRVYDGDPDSGGNLIWIAPIESEEGQFDGYVDTALPFSFNVQDGTKPYIDVEVLCFDRRMVNEYGYPFFDLVPGKLFPLCFFANFCPPSGRHFVANYSVDLVYRDGENEVVLYEGAIPNTGNNGSNYFADPLCLVVPESPFEDLDENYLFYVITPLDWPGSYGDIDNTPLVEVGLSWNDVEGLLNDDGETAEYIHIFIGCEPPIDDCPGVPTPSDPDGDCVPDDQCPDEPGSAENFGCPDDECPGVDTDQDGIADVCDNCPETSNPDQADTDGDGLGDACDTCPDRAGTPNNFGCPLDDCVNDTDGDGVVDCDDLCPDTQGPADNDGCPEDEEEETCETAFMWGDTPINTLDGVTRWGWVEHFEEGQGQTEFTIWAGAGQNQTSKGEAVGTATISVDGDGDVHLVITMDEGYSLDELHVNLTDNEPSGSVAKAPGQYNMNDHVDAGTLEYEFTDFDFTGGDFWIIVHTVTCGVENDD